MIQVAAALIALPSPFNFGAHPSGSFFLSVFASARPAHRLRG
jgi:hypothetical protein